MPSKECQSKTSGSLCFEQNEMNQAAYLSDEYFDTPYSFLPPNNPYATEDVEKYETNVEKAKELLQEAGVSNLQLNLAFTSTDPAQNDSGNIDSTTITASRYQRFIGRRRWNSDLYRIEKSRFDKIQFIFRAAISWEMIQIFMVCFSKRMAAQIISKHRTILPMICLLKQRLS